ncbi:MULTISPECIES: GNAT family N-acetyltransferase [unclassified Streptomyces]|uniref:GNAT family N-acetyltransferase n=1 Tax=unclassified Streptomyces TaxID=2593676 RepID=UPI00136EFCC5|nr:MULTISPECIES: GNAT family N-acetyltransferase [unclassified Streptomyces]MCW5250721.1 GNAT family N-acetyltransferase [Streptomyces sp. SHP 1-2]MYU26261.1 GNAT family N-acetyltransferase [Streptomyces sp. SID8352]
MTYPDIDVRPIREDELPDWSRAMSVGFQRSPAVSPEVLEARRGLFVPGRLLGAFDGERCVATYRSFDQEVTAVGGAPVPADAVSNVTVSATHRRRGLLSRMMAHDLAAARERGDVVATLIAAEYPIYGRYGFGPATSAAEWTIDVPRTGLDRGRPAVDDGGRVDFVDGAEVRALGPGLHERLRRARPGAVSRTEQWWLGRTGLLDMVGQPWTEPHHVVYRSPEGEVEGMAAYRCDDHWGEAKQPECTATVSWLAAVTPAAERALWRFLCSLDWVTTVKSGHLAPDDLLPHFLPDPRAARLTSQTDWLWVRVLDVVRALEARTYGGAGSLVLEVVDPDGPAAGRWRLEAGDGGASCAATTASPDLVLDAPALASLWLGDESAVRLAALGRVREERTGAVGLADTLLRAPRRPWCPDMF